MTETAFHGSRDRQYLVKVNGQDNTGNANCCAEKQSVREQRGEAGAG